MKSYAIGGMGSDDLESIGNVNVRYAIISPSTYAYLDDTRPDLLKRSMQTCDFCDTESVINANYTFKTPVTLCPAWNNWKAR
jgi:hypothetical protein